MTTEEHIETSHADAHERAHPGPGEYIKVAGVLAVITALEVGAYYVTGLSAGVLSALLLSMMVVKFALVALWFMHLRFDSILFRRLFVTGIILAGTVYTIAMVTLGLLVGKS